MKKFHNIIGYIIVYVLFAFLYSLNFKGFINIENIRLCLTSSVIPSLVGGTAISLFNE